MERRTYLGALGTVGITSVAGCLGDLLGGDSGNSNPNTILEPPEEEAQHADFPYPSYGDEFPSFSLTDPLTEETVSRDDFVGERPFVMTYFYASCPDGMCDQLMQHFRRIQEDAIESGYEDDVGLLAMTFDPERDTAEVLRTYSTERGIEPDTGHWHYLRPEDNEAAKTLLNETFKLPLRRDEAASNNESTNETASNTESGNETASNNESGNESADTDDLEYTFTHSAHVQLVNERGIVERAYPKAHNQREAVNTEVMVEDTRTVVGVDE